MKPRSCYIPSRDDATNGGVYLTELVVFCRMVFAVMTTTSVLIYDTQHPHPLAYIGGCHLASINDAAWSADGRMLVFCSSDGYVSFARFTDDCLGGHSSHPRTPVA
jgi:chromatin assembly factor 1 subunit B